MQCPSCDESKYCKDGFIKNKQRYLCQSCSYRWTVKRRSTAADNATKRKALEMYLEGLSFRAIGRILGFSNVAVLNWIRGVGENISTLKNKNTIKVMEIDEMHSYIGSKKKLAGYGLLLIDMEKNSSILTSVNERQIGKKTMEQNQINQ